MTKNNARRWNQVSSPVMRSILPQKLYIGSMPKSDVTTRMTTNRRKSFVTSVKRGRHWGERAMRKRKKTKLTSATR